MWRLSHLIGFAILVASSCASDASSLYLTTKNPRGDHPFGTSSDGYVFIAPYFADVRTQLTISMVLPPSKSTDPQPPPPSFTISVTPIPVSRAYLYLLRDASFSDTVNVSVGADGLLTSSDTSSVQQFTALLTELAQLGGLLMQGGPSIGTPSSPDRTDRKICNERITAILNEAPYYYFKTDPFDQIKPEGEEYDIFLASKDAISTKDVKILLRVTPTFKSNGKARIRASQKGLIAFFPAPARADLICRVSDTKGANDLLLIAPITVNLYTESRFVDPQRDFLTDPKDTFTFNAGFITGHKYSDQSAAKTVVDTITAPIRALLPSVSISQQTQVQTGGGKPDQTTSTTQKTIGPPRP